MSSDLSPGQRVLFREAMLAMDADGSFDKLDPKVRGPLLDIVFPVGGDEAVIEEARSRAAWAEEMQRVQRLYLDRLEILADRIFAATGGAPRCPYNRHGYQVRNNAHDLDAIEAALASYFPSEPAR